MRLIVLDLDGTLLNEEQKISPRNQEALQQRMSMGDRIAIGTGRNYLSAKRMVDGIGIDVPIIANNGATIHLNGEQIYKKKMPLSIVQSILQDVNYIGLTAMVSTDKGLFVSGNTIELLKSEIMQIPIELQGKASRILQLREQMAKENTFYHTFNDENEFLMMATEVYKVFVFSFIRSKLEKMKELYWSEQDLSITSSGKYNVEFMCEGVSKGVSVKFLANQLDISLERIVAIGDNYNDLSMFQVAGTSIAMGNGEDEIKSIATFVTKDHCQDGVAFALENFI